MALRALMLNKKLKDARSALQALEQEAAEFETREAELAASIDEAATDEEKAAVEEAVSEFETERAAHNDKKTALEKTIEDLEKDLAEEERAQITDSVTKPEERTAVAMPIMKRFKDMNYEERSAFVEREDVKSYLAEVRTCIAEKRALTNVGLTIPEVMLGLLRENILDYSKLYKHVTVRAIGGNGRAVVMGTIPEAIWTDCCANINELDLAFADLELECWKVGGYFAVCNANLEDSDIDLASELLTALGQAIGLALDKAILYGTGTRMPLGIMTRLVQTSEPEDYPATARTWVDLHTSNIKSHAATVKGKDLFVAIVGDSGAAKNAYSRGGKVWVMNETTYTALMAEAVSIDANGNIVSGVAGTMPVVGGVIEVLNFVPNNVIIGGYFDLYLLAERAGQKFATSEHVRFLQDQTVFKGTARYDGQPSIAEGFVAIGIGGTTPNATMTFASDTANP